MGSSEAALVIPASQTHHILREAVANHAGAEANGKELQAAVQICHYTLRHCVVPDLHRITTLQRSGCLRREQDGAASTCRRGMMTCSTSLNPVPT